MVKHGRKEQFSITINSEVADKIYEYIEKHDILYKNIAFEQLLNHAFNHIELLERYEEDQWLLFKRATEYVMKIVNNHAPKNKTLKKYTKMHYDELETIFKSVKISADIP